MKTDHSSSKTEPQKRRRDGDKRLICRISLFVLFATQAFLCLNALTDWEAPFLFSTHGKTSLALLTAFLIVIAFGMARLMQKFLAGGTESFLRGWMAVGCLLAFCLQLYFLFHVRNLYLFDNAFVTGGASTLAMGEGVAPQALYYFSVYPNQNAYIVLTAALWKLGTVFGMSRGQIPLLLNSVNLICLDTAFFLTYKSYVLLSGKKDPLSRRAGFLTLILLNPFLYIGVCYYYTITLSMPFFMAIIFLYLKYFAGDGKGTAGARSWLLLGAVFGIGFLLRATTVIPMIAVIFTWFYFGTRKKEVLFGLLAGMLLIVGIGKGNAALIGLDTTDTAFPATHWIMMSMTGTGAHNEEDEAYTAGFATKQEKRDGVRARMREKLAGMTLRDAGRLAAAKLKNTWGDGSNGYTVYLENCVRTDGIYEAVFGAHKDFVLLYHQVYYLFLIALFLRSIAFGFLKSEPNVFLLQLTYLGGILFYLIWETGGQYSIPFLPVLMLAAVGSDNRVVPNWNKGAEKNAAAPKTMRRLIPYLGRGLYLLAAVYVAFFFAKSFRTFTSMEQRFEHAVVRQILANDEVPIGKEDTFRQEFETDQPFNHVVFQYTNPDSATDAVYRMQLSDDGGNILFAQDLPLKDAPARNAADFLFDRVVPRGRQVYRIEISRLSGTADAPMGVIVYTMGHYDANPAGACMLGGRLLESDLLMAVSEVREAPYMSKMCYLGVTAFFAVIVLLPIFGNLVYTDR